MLFATIHSKSRRWPDRLLLTFQVRLNIEQAKSLNLKKSRGFNSPPTNAHFGENFPVILLYKMVSFLHLKISTITELIGFSISGKLHNGPVVVLGYFISDISLGLV